MIKEEKFKNVQKIGEKTFGYLKVSEAKISKNNVRQTDLAETDKLDERLAKNIKGIGLQQLPIANGNGEVFIGGRRLKAYRINGEDYILVEIRDTSDLEQKIASYSENKHRKETTADGEGRLFKAIIKETGMSHRELAKKLREPHGLISNRIRIAEMCHGRTVPYGTGDPSEKKVVTTTKASIICQDSIPKDAREKMFDQIEEDGMTKEELSKVIATSKAALEHLEHHPEKVQKKVKANLKKVLWTPKLKIPIFEWECYKAWGDSVVLTKKKYPESKFKNEEEANKYASRFGGASNGLQTVKNWVLELDTIGEKKWKEAEKARVIQEMKKEGYKV